VDATEKDVDKKTTIDMRMTLAVMNKKGNKSVIVMKEEKEN